MKSSAVVSVPDIKKYLNRDGLDEYNSLLPHSSAEMQTYVNEWMDEHPEASTTVQDGAITERKLADKSVSLRTLADDTVHMLRGAILTRNLSGNVLSADDAYSAPPVALAIEGKSTQDGTPTPDTPVEIVSLEQVTLHASADGTTDAANWPVLLNLTHALRSLPNGTHDTLSLTYLRPSTREGWAWYTSTLTKVTNEAVFDESYNWSRNAGTKTSDGTWRFECNIGNKGQPISIWGNTNTAVPAYCSHLLAVSSAWLYRNGTNRFAVYQQRLYVRISGIATLDELKAWLAENPITVVYPISPTTETLDPIELPVLPAPDVTIWSDPSTGLQIECVRDSNLVIQRIEQAIADQ